MGSLILCDLVAILHEELDFLKSKRAVHLKQAKFSTSISDGEAELV